MNNRIRAIVSTKPVLVFLRECICVFPDYTLCAFLVGSTCAACTYAHVDYICITQRDNTTLGSKCPFGVPVKLVFPQRLQSNNDDYAGSSTYANQSCKGTHACFIVS